MVDGYRPMRPECKEAFDLIHRRIDKRDATLSEQEKKIEEHSVSIAKTSEDVIHITKSMGALTKALWGLAASLMAALFGFVLWYIQHL